VIHQLLESARERELSKAEAPDSARRQAKLPTTLAKQEKLQQLERMPVAVLDLTAGHRGEEPGYGYLRPKYVFDHGALHSYYAGKDHAKKEEQVEAALQQMHELDAIVS
tara:strand:+ start:645 stop:971 length:327 start_codon:yes stop_codon:yes gene_type:complete